MTRALGALLDQSQASDAAAALIPWFCDSVVSQKSRTEYYRDIKDFLAEMATFGLHPYQVTGDHVRLYKEAMVQAGAKAGSVDRALSVIRGTYRAFGSKGLVAWNVVGDIQAVRGMKGERNTTPNLTEQEAKRLLHAPDINTPIGLRDHAMIFTFFITVCRVKAIATARVGDIERSDLDYYLRVTEKGDKVARKPLLEAAKPLLRYLQLAGILEDKSGPLFRPLGRDRRGFEPRHISERAILDLVKVSFRQACMTHFDGGAIVAGLSFLEDRHEWTKASRYSYAACTWSGSL